MKNIERKHLPVKYEKIELYGVTAIEVDEVFMGKTIVRELKTGAVLYIGNGEKGECLDKFKKVLDAVKMKVTSVAVDLSVVFTSLIKKDSPDAIIVYDHFHIINLINDKLSII